MMLAPVIHGAMHGFHGWRELALHAQGDACRPCPCAFCSARHVAHFKWVGWESPLCMTTVLQAEHVVLYMGEGRQAVAWRDMASECHDLPLTPVDPRYLDNTHMKSLANFIHTPL